jgi:hypothetical protein
MRLSRFLTVLSEARMESSLYHFLDTSHVLDALNRGSFQLGIASAVDDRFQKGRPFYLSMSRSPVGRYTRDHRGGVIIEFNKDWLRSRYKIIPVDHWEGMKSGAIPDSEQEDRLISDRPSIPIPTPATDMIRAIHLTLSDDDRWTDTRGMTTERRLVIAAKRLGIPVHLYNGRNYALPSQEVSLGSAKDKLMKTPVDAPWPRSYRSSDSLKPYVELLYATKKSELSKRATRILSNIVGFYVRDAINTLDGDLHNARSMDREAAHKLVVQLRKFGIRSPKQYVEFVENRWKPILDAERAQSG